ncbi:hypothetical protein [Microcoleus sp. B4-D4]|uniref:hypothetical protein n=1 Tax=Microcoleus sp. B4-D4 TaxID=2818667 RepID=UPI002FD24279
MKEEGSSATSNVRDVTDVTDVSLSEEGRGKKEEGRSCLFVVRTSVCSWLLLKLKKLKSLLRIWKKLKSLLRTLF